MPAECAGCHGPAPARGNTAALTVTFASDVASSTYTFCSPPCIGMFIARGPNRALLWELVGRQDLADAADAELPPTLVDLEGRTAIVQEGDA